MDTRNSQTMSPEGLSQKDKSTLDLLNGLVRVAEMRQPPGYVLPEEDSPNMTEAELEEGVKQYKKLPLTKLGREYRAKLRAQGIDPDR